MQTNLHLDLIKMDQARFLVDHLRGRGVGLVACRDGDGYTLATISPEPLADEIDAQLRQFKHEILVLLCEEDLSGKGGA